MTRINLIPPSCLTTPHLVAEFRELPRVFTLGKAQHGPAHGIPKTYTLGKGHVRFFYDKGFWLQQRYMSLYHEMIRRDFKPNHDMVESILKDVELNYPRHLFNNWNPSPEEVYLNMKRLTEQHYADIDTTDF